MCEQHDQHCLLTVMRENGYTFRITHIGPGGLTLEDHNGMAHVRWRNEVAPSRGWFRTGGNWQGDKVMRYTIIEPGPVRSSNLISLNWIETNLPATPSIKQLFDILTGLFPDDYPEHVSVNSYNGPADMFVGENSAVRRLPVNELATMVYWTASILPEVAKRSTTPNVQEWSKQALLLAAEHLKAQQQPKSTTLAGLGGWADVPYIHGRAVLFDGRVWF